MFLNKSKFIESLFQLFEEADKELVLIVPYVKMSLEIYDALKKCDRRGVEILMVCRKDCLTDKELNKLKRLNHLTLLSHPNLHSKIYLNEHNIIIGSMNLYEYSEKFNREAGLRIRNVNGFGSEDVEDCKKEIKEIISGSQEIIVSDLVEKEGVDFRCIALEEENLAKKARTLSQFFTTKNFTVLETSEGLYPTCVSFYDNIDVVVSNRIAIMPKFSDDVNASIFKKNKDLPENKYAPLRLYVSEYQKIFTIYAPDGDLIEHHIYTDKTYAKGIANVVMDFCQEIDSIYKRLVH